MTANRLIFYPNFTSRSPTPIPVHLSTSVFTSSSSTFHVPFDDDVRGSRVDIPDRHRTLNGTAVVYLVCWFSVLSMLNPRAIRAIPVLSVHIRAYPCYPCVSLRTRACVYLWTGTSEIQ